MSKPTPVRVPSDDQVVKVTGQLYHPHEGEYVDVLPGVTIGFIEDVQTLNGLSARASAGKLSAKEQDRFDIAFENILEALVDRIVEWTWTDDRGRLIPLDGVAAVRALRAEEVWWLVAAIQRADAEPKAPSETAAAAAD